MLRGAHAAALVSLAAPGMAQTGPRGTNLEQSNYPLPVKWDEASSQGRPVQMAYMTTALTARTNGRTVVRLHDKNFCAATWGYPSRALAAKGFHVIVPDQVGFCESSKPTEYQCSFRARAALTTAARAGQAVTAHENRQRNESRIAQ